MNWISVKDRLPEEGRIVMVNGGSAMRKEDGWVSGMEHPYFERLILWPVKHWAEFPHRPHD